MSESSPLPIGADGPQSQAHPADNPQLDDPQVMITVRLFRSQRDALARRAAAADMSMNRYAVQQLGFEPLPCHGKVRGRKVVLHESSLSQEGEPPCPEKSE